MKVKNVVVSVGRTVNLGNFNSIRTELSIDVDITSENYESEIDEIYGVAEYNLEKMINRRINKLKSGSSSDSYSKEEFIG